MKQGKLVFDEDILLIDKEQFMKVFVETLEETLRAEIKTDEPELAELMEKSLELADFGALLTYNLFDGD